MSKPFSFYPIEEGKGTSSLRDLIDFQVQAKMLEMLNPKKDEKKDDPKKDKFTFLQLYCTIVTLGFVVIWPAYLTLIFKIALSATTK